MYPREPGRFEITHVPALIRERDRRITGRNRRELGRQGELRQQCGRYPSVGPPLQRRLACELFTLRPTQVHLREPRLRALVPLRR